MTPLSLIARAIQRERNKSGMSLTALAKQAGLAKSTLSQLESGQGNPSIETLWAIATALDVPFSFLFETPTEEFRIIRQDEGDATVVNGTDYAATLLASCPPGIRRDLYRMTFNRGSVREASAHPAGTVEHVFVASGKLRAGPAGRTEELEAGDYYRFPADVAHSYEALSDAVLLMVMMENPR